MSQHARAQQKSLWPERTKLTGIRNGSPMVQAVADALTVIRAAPHHHPEDRSATFEFSSKAQLPQYIVSLPDHYATRILDAFDGARPHCTSGTLTPSVTTIRVLDETELKNISPGPCAPFALGDCTDIAREVRAAGRLYWVCLNIQVSHLGEAIVGDKPVVIIEPSICVHVRPYPDDDSALVLREALLEAFNQKIKQRSKRLEHSVIPDAFPAGEGRVPNNHVVNAGLLALNKAGKHAQDLEDGWFQNASGRPTFKYEPTQAKRILVYANPGDSNTNQVVNTERLWSIIEGYTPETSSVAFAVLGQLCEPSVGDSPKYPMLTPVSITDEAILSYMGVGQNREAARLMIHTAMENLRELSFDVSFSSPVPGRGLFWQGDRLFHIVKIEYCDENMFSGEKRTVSTIWAVRAGLWASAWFTPDTRQYIGSMARVLLQLGSRGKRLVANRIGQRLLLLSQAYPQRVVEISIRTLLGDIGELLLPDKREKNWASRIRASVEEALDLLTTGGLLKTVEWPDGFGSGDIDRSKGWSGRWLNARIRVTTMANRRARWGPARASQSHGKHVDRTDDLGLIGTDTRFARTNIVPYWTQEELARELGICRRHLSDREQEKAAIPYTLRKVARLDR